MFHNVLKGFTVLDSPYSQFWLIFLNRERPVVMYDKARAVYSCLFQILEELGILN